MFFSRSLHWFAVSLPGRADQGAAGRPHRRARAVPRARARRGHPALHHAASPPPQRQMIARKVISYTGFFLVLDGGARRAGGEAHRAPGRGGDRRDRGRLRLPDQRVQHHQRPVPHLGEALRHRGRDPDRQPPRASSSPSTCCPSRSARSTTCSCASPTRRSSAPR